MILKLTDILNSDLALFHKEGLDVYQYLKNALENKEHIKISFEGIKRCSTQFLNASIGKLYLEKDTVIIDSFISYDFAGQEILKQKMEEVKQNALNSASYNSYIESALN